MFRVESRHVMEDDIAAQDAELFRVVGRESDYSGASKHPEDDRVIRMHGWMVEDFMTATGIRDRLEGHCGVVATIQEK